MNRRLVLLTATLFVAASCQSDDRKTPSEPRATPQLPGSLISDGAHSGTPGFFFLFPLVPPPQHTGTFDGDIAAVNPVVAICDITGGPAVACGASTPGATPALRTYTATSNPPISVLNLLQTYVVPWNTREPGFDVGRLYRVYVFAGADRRELGFIDVRLTARWAITPNNEIIEFKDGFILPILFRIEEGVVPSAGPARSLGLTALPATLASGAMASVTVTARDENGNVATGYRGTVAFSASDPGATLPSQYTFTEGDAGVHTFSNAISFTTAGTATVRVTDAADATIFGEASLTVVALDAVSLEVNGLLDPVLAGAGNSVTVTARDASGNIATGYTGTIAFTSNDPQATLPENYTFTAADAGTHAFPGVTLRTAGSVTVTATDQAVNTITGAQTVTVTPAAASKLVFSGLPESLPSGTTASVTVTTQDQFGNTATGYRGTVVFTSSNQGATLPSPYTFTEGDAGVHAFTNAISFTTAGPATVRVTDAADATIFGEASLTVLALDAVRLDVTGLPDPVQAGVGSSVTVTARDANGNVATGYVGTIAFTSNDPQATLPPSYTFTAADAGTHTFPEGGVTLRTAGSITVTATDQAISTITGAQTVTVTPAAAARLVLSGIPAQTTAGVANNVTVTAQDEFGNTATGYGGTVQFSSNDAAATLPAAYSFQPGDAGVRSFPGGVTFRTAGPRTLQATDAAAPAIDGSVATLVGPAAAAELRFTTQPSNAVAGSAIAPPIVVTAFDAFGNLATSFSQLVTVAIGTNPGGGILSGTLQVAAAAGVATFTNLSINAAGIGYTLVASATGVPSATSEAFNITAPAPVDVHWINPLGGLWSVGSNWSTGAPPAADQNAFIDLAGTYTVTLDVNSAVNSFSVGAASGVQSLSTTNLRTLNFLASGNILSTGRVTLTGSTLTGPAVSVAAGGVLSLSTTSTVNAALVNAGTLAAGVPPFFCSATLNGALTTVAGSLVRVQAGASNGCTLTVASGFTNHGTIELTKAGDAIGGSGLTVASGTLVNAPDGTISSVAGSGGGRTLTAQLDNQGTVSLGLGLAIDRSSADHTNSGTINVTGGNLTLTQTGTTPSITNTGTVTVAAGRTWAITGGSFTQVAAATLDGGGAMTLSNMNPAVFGSAFSLGALSLTTTIASFATDISTETLALSLTNSTLNGPGTLTNVAGRTLPLSQPNTINTAVTNAGTLQLGVAPFSSNSTITGAFTTVGGSLVRVTAMTSSNSTLTVSNGFTNHGTIELTKAGDAIGTAILVVTTGTLVNAPDGTISTVVGSGGGRTLAAQLDNQGTVSISQPLVMNASSADHTNSGTINVTGANLTLTQSGTTPSFTNTGTVTVAAGRTWAISTGSFTQAAAATLDGGGTMTLTGVNPAVFGSAFSLGALSLNTTIASFATDITTETLALSLTASTVNGPGTLTNAAARTLPLSSANTINTAVINAGTLAVGAVATPPISSSSTITGAFTSVAGSLVRVTATTSASSRLTVATGFTNHGTIELTKVGDNIGAAFLTVTTGALINAPDGTISTVVGSGGGRVLEAQLDNQGTVTLAQLFEINRTSADHLNSGTINVAGGNLTVTQSGTTPSFTNSGIITVAAARTAIIGVGPVTNGAGGSIQGAGTFETGTTASFNNAGNVTVALMRIGDGLASTGTFAPVTAEFFGSATTIPVGAGFSYNNVRVLSAASFAGSASMTGSLIVLATGNLTIGAQDIAVGGSFATQNTGLLTMQNAAGVLAVAGNATFGGGNTNTRLTAGTLRVGGNFVQTVAAATFAASVNHLTVLNGSGAQSVIFANPGTTTALSHFHRLQIENTSTAGVTLLSAAFATGQLRTPAGPTVARTLSSAGQTLQVGGLDAAGLVLDGMPLRVVNGEAIIRFDDAVFQDMDPAATQFRLDRLADVVTFNNIQFQTTPTTGVYLHLVDTDLAAPLFTVTMQGTQPPNHGGRIIESVAGQLVGWPF